MDRTSNIVFIAMLFVAYLLKVDAAKWSTSGENKTCDGDNEIQNTLSTEESPRAGLVTYDEFANAVANNNYPRPSGEKYNFYVQGLPGAAISTKQEAAMILAHMIHETGGLQKKVEQMCRNTGCPGVYSNPCDLQGRNYYGRGYLQLTWCYNYRDASKALFGDLRLLEDPDSVANVESYSWSTAFWFWKDRVHNYAGVSNGEFGSSTRAINGGEECVKTAGHPYARRRFQIYGVIRAAFGLPGPGNPNGCY